MVRMYFWQGPGNVGQGKPGDCDSGKSFFFASDFPPRYEIYGPVENMCFFGIYLFLR
jgi:hypothetical protein